MAGEPIYFQLIRQVSCHLITPPLSVAHIHHLTSAQAHESGTHCPRNLELLKVTSWLHRICLPALAKLAHCLALPSCSSHSRFNCINFRYIVLLHSLRFHLIWLAQLLSRLVGQSYFHDSPSAPQNSVLVHPA